ncbi:TetR/AcrR family transcriptional regulator [Tsukamurella pseudospumae]|uniref:Transcriptional regulator n=1 Tax=Tsukamurella pseudospumae TaxID=239498 RepID=A0A138AIR7_9ACTN|nr:TetR family transcriptional regulator C-terminal domain-containing protein [Tsukamurella pseudospumae]KXP00070.1 transcriptional regulator [Tsukamurella pseudospumae]KXP10330.1 transcriptional regulator [Tsukamurella pseudospumae]
MPRQVDHDERRRQIAEAVWRLAMRGGLEQVTLRQVATEADVSARLLQYYFGTRDQVLLGALEILNADAERQAKRRMDELGESPTIRTVVRGVLLEMLPLDQERRDRHTVYAAYFVRFLTEPALASVAEAATSGLADLVTDLIAAARAAGQVVEGVEPAVEGAFLTAGAEGLQTRMLLSQLSSDDAIAIIDRQLDRVFTTA